MTSITPIDRPPKGPEPFDDDRETPPMLMTHDEYEALVETTNYLATALEQLLTEFESMQRIAERRWNSTVTNTDTATIVSTVKDLHRRVNRIESALGEDKVAVLRPGVK